MAARSPSLSVTRTRAELIATQAHDARMRGEAALAADDIVCAHAWFERGLRLVPQDPSLMLALAGVKLRSGDAGAIALFQAVAEVADTREAWLGLVASALQAGDRSTARWAVITLLQQHVLPADIGSVAKWANQLADGQIGWCGVVASGANGALAPFTSLPGAEAWVDGTRVLRRVLRPTGHILEIQRDGIPLLGSPIDLTVLRRVEGIVAAQHGGLVGWAWLPGHAECDPWITLTPRQGGAILRLRATNTAIPAHRPLSRPRGFAVPAECLAASSGLWDVTGPDGRQLLGSPIDPHALDAPARDVRLARLECPAIGPIRRAKRATTRPLPPPLPARALPDPQRPVCVVIPVYAGREQTLACLHSVFDSLPPGHPIIVVDDASPDPTLTAALLGLAQSGRITLMQHRRNQGFPTAANTGLRAAFALQPPHDALLLNSDTRVPPRNAGRSWLERLRAAAHAAADIGTVTPMSNNASILSYPDRDHPQALPDASALASLDALAQRANDGDMVEIPTSVGFCMYLKRECAVATGLFRPSLFAQGYGEENDFCLRAQHLGWRHLAAPGVFVAHAGAASFGASQAPLLARNLAVLERLHPGYHALIASYKGRIAAEDALASARRRMDALAWRDRRKPAAVILITHANGGGVERVVQTRARAITAAGQRAIILRPLADPNSAGGFIDGLSAVEAHSEPATPNLVYRLPEDLPALAALLAADHPTHIELHHRLGHPASVLQLPQMLGVPMALHLHDYAAFCPRITLIGADGRYCGEPHALSACSDCVAKAGDRTGEALAPADLRARSSAEFAKARQIIVPSQDAATRLQRHFPGLQLQVAALEDDAALPAPPIAPSKRRRICVIGAIGVDKGYDVLLACAQDASARDVPLDFVLVGHSSDDDALLQTGRVFITGPYAEADACALIRAQSADLAFLPSIWPETWGFTLGLAWQAGLRAVVFDIGAMAARVRATGYGALLPFGLPAERINQALLGR